MGRLSDAWRALRSWRRIYFTRGGVLFALGTFAVGFAAMNTGNNLLFLLLGAMLGSIALSGWLSEQAIRGLDVRRRVPRGATVQRPVRITYEVRNEKSRFPTYALELREGELPEAAYVARAAPGETVTVRSRHRFLRRGVYPLRTLTLSTSFPFGLFRKERDLEIPGELVIWPRTDRAVRPVAVTGDRARFRSSVPADHPGGRGEYRALREYRPGDDPRDIHWRSTASQGKPVVKEYERDGSLGAWICLDAGGDPGPGAEVAVEMAAALAARFARRGRRFGLVTSRARVDAGSGPAQLERVLDALARVEFDPGEPAAAPPVERERCVLVTTTGRGAGAYGDILVTGRSGSPIAPEGVA